MSEAKFHIKKSTFVAMLLFGIAIGMSIAFVKDEISDRNSKAFADKALNQILVEKNKQVLLEQYLEESKQPSHEYTVGRFFSQLSKLGKLEELQPATGDSLITRFESGRKVRLAKYKAEVEFNRGPATAYIVLLKQNGKWWVHKVYLDVAKTKKRIST